MSARTYVIAGAASVLLAAGSVAAFAATGHGGTGSGAAAPGVVASSCTVPDLPGQRLQVVLGDMGGGSMMGGRGPMMGGGPWGGGPWGGGRMVLAASPRTVSAGEVSFVAVDRGTLTHELVVLPLAAGATVGTRAVGSDGTVDEAGSLGEASTGCGAGAGNGIGPGQVGWVTLDLRPGRYELVCNLPGHYAAGMYAELDVR